MTTDLRDAAERAAKRIVDRDYHEHELIEIIMDELEPTKPAEPEAEKSLAHVAFDAAQEFHKRKDVRDSITDWYEFVTEAVESEVLRRAGVEQLRATLLVHQDLWKSTSGTPCEIARLIICQLGDKVKQLESELAALKSAAVPTSDSPCGYCGRYPRDPLACQHCIGRKKYETPPCLDIDGNALSVGDTICWATNPENVQVIKSLSFINDEWQVDCSFTWWPTNDVRKVAAPEKVVLTFTRVYADAYRDEQETA